MADMLEMVCRCRRCWTFALEYHSKVIVVHFISMQLFQLYSVVSN